MVCWGPQVEEGLPEGGMQRGVSGGTRQGPFLVGFGRTGSDQTGGSGFSATGLDFSPSR